MSIGGKRDRAAQERAQTCIPFDLFFSFPLLQQAGKTFIKDLFDVFNLSALPFVSGKSSMAFRAAGLALSRCMSLFRPLNGVC